MSVSVTFRGNSAYSAYQLRETRLAESPLNDAVTFGHRSVESVTARSLVRSPAAKIKQWLAFARCPIRVAQEKHGGLCRSHRATFSKFTEWMHYIGPFVSGFV